MYVNIACGDTYVNGWRNFDYDPHSSTVTKANLLSGLPLAENEAEVVYSSHFIEHIPRNLLASFLSECFRIIRPGGRLRLVLPDFEEMCGAYLSARGRGEHDKADFVTLEILDQCVRMDTGGELGRFYSWLQSSVALHGDMIEFVKKRTGYEIDCQSLPTKRSWRRILTNPVKITGKLERLYCSAILALLPPAFRRQNVSFASIGERHAWVYDFHTLSRALDQAGFVQIERVTSSTSSIPGFPFYPLDVNEDGSPRKGIESMYIEALKP